MPHVILIPAVGDRVIVSCDSHRPAVHGEGVVTREPETSYERFTVRMDDGTIAHPGSWELELKQSITRP